MILKLFFITSSCLINIYNADFSIMTLFRLDKTCSVIVTHLKSRDRLSFGCWKIFCASVLAYANMSGHHDFFYILMVHDFLTNIILTTCFLSLVACITICMIAIYESISVFLVIYWLLSQCKFYYMAEMYLISCQWCWIKLVLSWWWLYRLLIDNTIL